MNSNPTYDSKPQSRLYRYRYALLTTVAVIVIGGVLMSGKQAPAKPEEPRLIRTVTLNGYYSNNARFTGTVHSRTESDLGFRVNGKITQKLVDEGTVVKKGQILMQIDPVDLKLAFNAATQGMDAAKAQNVRALKDEARMRDLLKEHAVSLQEYERAKAEADASSAQLKAAIAQQDVASNAFGYSELQADADGVIMSVPADVGQVVAAGQTVIRLAHNGTREAVINLPEGALNLAQNATTAFLYTAPDSTIPVKLRELSAMADPVTRTYQARYTLEDNGQNAPLGATITVSFETKLTDGGSGFEVPLGALYDGGQGSSIWVVNDGNSTVHLVPVKILKLGEETASVSGELKSGEHVVALGAHLLKPNEKVRVASSEGQTK
jgi:RND family efflux transporter MFP subunit